jgi:Mg-chelatase subunit ChlD
MTMEKKHQVHNLIILDESGSMNSIKSSIIQGFNEIVETVKGIEKQFPEQQHVISLISFNGIGKRLLHFIDPVAQLRKINAEAYQPDASTPLYDAMGMGITKLMQVLQGQTDYNVLVTILTDGEENASTEYTGSQIKDLIEKLQCNHWTFTYIGADHDVEKFAKSLSITNSMKFAKTQEDMRKMFNKEKESRSAYSKKIRDKADTAGGFYEGPNPV